MTRHRQRSGLAHTLMLAIIGGCSGTTAMSDADTDVSADLAVTADAPTDSGSPDVSTDAPADSGSPADVVQDAPAVVSLAGSITCGTSTCTSGQVCVDSYGGIDSGMGGPSPDPMRDGNCVTAPDPCVGLVTCYSNDCGACLMAVCPYTHAGTVNGRYVTCEGE